MFPAAADPDPAGSYRSVQWHRYQPVCINLHRAGCYECCGLFAPINMFIGAVSTMLLGGSQILSAEYKGKNQVTRTQEVFSLDMVLSFAFSVFVAVLLAAAGAFNWTGMFTNDPAVRVFLISI